jgi:hypothetical protein
MDLHLEPSQIRPADSEFIPLFAAPMKDGKYQQKILHLLGENPDHPSDTLRFLSETMSKNKKAGINSKNLPSNLKYSCPFVQLKDRSSAWSIDGEVIYIQMGYLDDPEHNMIESIDKAISYEIERHLMGSGCGMTKENLLWKNAADEEMEIPVFKWRKQFHDHLYWLEIILVPPATEKEIEQVPSMALKHRLQSFAKDITSFVYFGHARYGKGMDILPYDSFKARYAENIFSGSIANLLRENQIHNFHILGCSAKEHLIQQGGYKIYRKNGVRVQANPSGAISFQKGIDQFFLRTINFH